MRTYDPADCIRYVHLGAGSAISSAPSREECQALPPGYANASFRDRICPAPGVVRPALVLLPGGSAEGDATAPAAPALSIAR